MALVSHPRPASRPHRHLPGLPARCHQPQVSESKQALCTRAENDAALPLETRGWQDAPQAALSAVCTPRSRWRRTGSVPSPVGTYSPSRRCWEHRLTPPAPSHALLLGPTQSSVLPLRPPFGLVHLYLYPVPPVWTTVTTRTGYGPAAGRPSRAAVWPHRTPWAQTPPRRGPAGGSEPLDVNEAGQPGL